MARSRLFLVTPVAPDADELARLLEAAFEGGDVASALLRHGGDEAALRAMTDAAMPLAFPRDVAVLLDDAPELAAELGADGVQIPPELTRYRHARTMVGAERIVGALCGRSRHAAMELGEAGADYVAFDEAASGDAEGESSVAWWAALFVVPCVAYAPAAPDQAARLARMGADFIRPPDEMWRSPERARETVRRLNAIMDDAEHA